MASIIALGLDVLEASPDPLADGEMLDCPKPLNVTGLSETDVIRLAALAGRHQLTDGQAIRLVIGTGLRWAQAARA